MYMDAESRPFGETRPRFGQDLVTRHCLEPGLGIPLGLLHCAVEASRRPIPRKHLTRKLRIADEMDGVELDSCADSGGHHPWNSILAEPELSMLRPPDGSGMLLGPRHQVHAGQVEFWGRPPPCGEVLASLAEHLRRSDMPTLPLRWSLPREPLRSYDPISLITDELQSGGPIYGIDSAQLPRTNGRKQSRPSIWSRAWTAATWRLYSSGLRFSRRFRNPMR